MDEIVRNIIDRMKDDDLFILLSDHGMTDDGNHGGDSKIETESIIFGYKKSGFYKNDAINNYNDKFLNVVDQIDICSTLSMLLAIPIPFNNLGIIINDFYSSSVSLDQIIEDYYNNLIQIDKYLNKIQNEQNKFSSENFIILKEIIENCKEDYKTMQNTNYQNQQQKQYQQELWINKLKQSINQIKNNLRILWNEYDQIQMYIGKIQLILCVIIGILNIFYFKILNNFYKISKLQSFKLSDIPFIYIIFSSLIIIFIFYFINLWYSIGIIIIQLQIQVIFFILSDFLQILKQDRNVKYFFPIYLWDLKTVSLLMYHAYHAYTMLAIGLMLKEDIVIVQQVLIGIIIEIVIQYKDHNFIFIYQYIRLLLIPLIMYLGLYLDVVTLIKYVIHQRKFELIQKSINILQESSIFQGLIFIFVFAQYIMRNLQNNKIKKIIYLNFFLVIIYQLLKELQIQNLKYLERIVLPRISILLFIINLIFIIKSNNKSSINLFLHNINLSSLFIMFIDKNGILLVALYHTVVNLYIDYSKDQKTLTHPNTFTFLAIFSTYFFFITGHRPDISTLQIQACFVGLENNNVYISGFLLLLNTFSAALPSIIYTQYIVKLAQESRIAKN
ncbi:hypothetical protein IMG5_031830 [Ichthyophthirius multifiliis]|uniref:Uncharacterized protein n=1 Tax=Ichthyophthirius multifiliis TaxID=5932 RepID=G0QLK2_ICHMU|nr:hypothetical protein IMG5_031830 [Ichthyophthirius multifiliis]EGR33902.1 hypothetical protein IMG5_031830 [Ichthyophthirius multifiliis]|eukprot:XP_004039206.1 hypothetical protein IMG5_031830 [Ichthyophthirius multifiliis]